MDFYKIIKGGVGVGMNNFDRLFAEKYGGGAWQLTTLTGTLPMSFKSKGEALTDYQIYGTADGAGVQTENLFVGWVGPYDLFLVDGVPTVVESSRGNVFFYAPVEEGQVYCVTSPTNHWMIGAFFDHIPEVGDIPYNSEYADFTSRSNVGNVGASVFTAPIDGYFVYNDGYTYLNALMLSVGNSPLSFPYIPYGYKLPMTVTRGEQSQSTPIYIGDSKLVAEEYVDYESGKIYKLKRVHENQVTIGGIAWDILGYDHDEVYKPDGTLAKHSVTIQTHDCYADLQFDAAEALFAFPNGLAAGTYYFTIDSTYDTAHNNYEGYQFTTTQDIPNKGQITFPWASFANASDVKVYTWASSSATTPLETLTTSNETSGTFLGQATLAIDTANNINAIQRARYGSNKWSTSALKQLLNSDKAAGTFWKAQTVFDRPPSWAANTAGFLYGMDPDFVSVIGRVNKRTALNTVSDGGGYEDSVEKVFLLSRSEVYAGEENNIDEGGPYDYFKDFSDFSAPSTGKDTNRIKYRNGTVKYWWLRSPYTDLAHYVRDIAPSGELYNYYSAANSLSVAPACCIILDDIADNLWLREHFLQPTDPPIALPEISTYQGDNTLSCSETLGEVSITGFIKGV